MQVSRQSVNVKSPQQNQDRDNDGVILINQEKIVCASQIVHYCVKRPISFCLQRRGIT